MVLSDEKIVHYWVPTMKLETYTRNSIFEKNLLMLLPFYIMRYEKDIHEGSTIRVLRKFHDSLIISSANRKIVLGNEVADRIQV